MSEETIVAVYDTAAHAAAAASDLLGTGVPATAITQHAKDSMTAVGSATSTQGQGFWSSLFGGEPEAEHDTSVYDRSVEGGSVVVTVKAPADHVDAVMATLERHNPIDIDERGTSYAGTQAQTLKPVIRSEAAPAASQDKIQLAEESLVVGKRNGQPRHDPHPALRGRDPGRGAGHPAQREGHGGPPPGDRQPSRHRGRLLGKDA